MSVKVIKELGELGGGEGGGETRAVCCVGEREIKDGGSWQVSTASVAGATLLARDMRYLQNRSEITPN